MVRAMDSVSMYSVNSRDRNSPALSIWSCPTMRTGSDLPTLDNAFNLATKERIRFSASDLCLRK